MEIYLTMPQPGETITEATLISWKKSVGDKVQLNEELMELETEKAVFDFESPIEGILKEILVEAPATIKVGAKIACFEVSDEARAKKYIEAQVAVAKDQNGSVQTESSENEVSPDHEEEKLELKEKEKKPDKEKKEKTKQSESENEANNNENKIEEKKDEDTKDNEAKTHQFLSPYLKKIARENKISENDLQKIQGTGQENRITESDLINFAKNKKQSSSGQGGDSRKNLIRLRIAENMQKSKREIPHAGASLSIDMTSLVSGRSRIKDNFSKIYECPLSLFAVCAFISVQVLKENPALNSHWSTEGKIENSKEFHLGISVSTEQGLMLPILKSVDKMNFVEFSKKLNQVVGRVRQGQLKPEDLGEGTFTVNNPGALGSESITQIIPPGQAAICGFNAILKKPAVHENEIKIRDLMRVDLHFDHRAADGKEALDFLNALKVKLETLDLNQLIENSHN